MNHFDKAVKLSLECCRSKIAKETQIEHFLDLSKKYSNKPEDQQIRKGLWMKIARYLFNDQNFDDSDDEGI